MLFPPAIVVGAELNGLGVARPLARAGIPVWAVATGEPHPAERSRAFARVATAEKTALVPFLLKGIADGPDAERLFQADRIHPREEAHPRMLANVWPELRRLLK